ncbi:FG-GAP repeat domain-containing protein [Hamadaea tsunoensis]|uniref:FG-GAP repeat domain-containing protein n=1 Tax=Hamadaea tsunoensis TaxID=53368 RepID=UPI000483827A|nr:VCBS repeat-containing protein [Hamadaea tsunoensis]
MIAATALVAAAGIVALAPPASAAARCPHPVTSAADRRTALASARSCGHRVQAADQTDEQSQTYANPDGSYTVETAATPQRVRQADGSWAAIDTALRPVGGRIAPRVVTEKVSFSGGGTGPLAAVDTKAGRFALGWPGVLPVPSIEGDTAVYANVRPEVDLRVRALPTGFTYVLVVRDRTALTTFQPVHLTVSGPAVRPRADGGAEVVAPDGSVLLSSGGGVLWDSSGEASATGPGDTTRSAPVGVRAGSGEIVLTPDPAALADPALKLPVFIDPQTSGRNRWAYSDSSNSDRNDGIARVGLNPDGSGIYRSFFEFPTSAVVGTRIIAASVSTLLTHSWSCGSTPVDLYWAGGLPAGVNGTRVSYSTALLASLDEEWGNAHKPSSGAGCGNDPQPDMPMTFTGGLTGKVQEWANAGVTATTLAFSARDVSGNNEGTTDRWKKFDVGSTWLIIKYNSLPGTPPAANLSASGITATIPCYTAGTDGQPYINASGGVHLKATLTDNDSGDNLVARYEWQDVSAGTAVVTVPDTPAFPSGHQFDVTIPGTSFPNGHNFQWRVHGFDGTDNGSVSAWCHFGYDSNAPGQPLLTSSDLPVYPAAPTANDVTGTPASVTATPANGDTDIVGYYYGVGSVPTDPTVYIPAAPGGVGTIPVVPVVSGIAKNFLTVVAVDAAGNRSPVPVSQADAAGTRQFRADPGTVHHVHGDVTGDGKADITTAFDLGAAKSKLLDFTTKADGSTVFNPASPVSSDPYVMELYSSRQYMGDFNGDGKSDLVSIRNEGNCRTTGSVYLSNGNGLAASPSPWWDSGVNSWCFYTGDKTAVGDFNGDGMDDIASLYNFSNAQTKLYVMISTGTSFTPPVIWWDSGVGNFDWTLMRIVAGDFNHDGKDDIGALYDYLNCHAGMFRFLSSGSGLIGGWPARTWFVTTQYAWCAANTMNLLPGDFNGDGYADIASMYYYGNGVWKVFTWFGPDLANGAQIGAASGYSDAANVKAFTGDFNGDGKTDLAHFYASGTGRSTLWVLYNTGSALSGENLRWDSNNGGGLDWNALRVIQ